ncbi:glycosyltransferase family protein [Conexibacter woesei]|uniref:Spore protein YkvP/CgeB glycosyl transferase-like domain-containing protein n=1 Tax=Conexibacter woesei (strain DSM 14684 / CCUG 47730 / CIP 108061 / JCM 11494 / NBRC 100937 / ID131577) TaxID=469383 RepID=D3FFE8_CONWI|nr:glycosyltransferase [Conexibacter woesei]ADB53741.1 hypothetical protein Cwoe_5335 [Conexibacter woesei DSM 14684]
MLTSAMRIGILTNLEATNSAYRAFPVAELAALGHEVIVDGRAEHAERARLFRCDVVHVYRYDSRPIQMLVRALRDAGVAIVWDVDDDLGAIPDASPTRHAKGGMQEQRLLRDVAAMAHLADVVTTTSMPLADSYRRVGADCVHIVENFLPRLYTAGPARPHAGIVIGWVASGEHLHDLEHLRVREWLESVLEREPDVRVRSIGIDLGLPRDRYEREIAVAYRDLGQRIAEFDIAIAPLDDIQFNRARSNVKLKEYAAAGVPWLASPIGPYRGLGEKQGGRLVPNHGWAAAVERLVHKPRERRKLAKRGLSWARGQTAAYNLERWEAPLAEAVQRARRRSPR